MGVVTKPAQGPCRDPLHRTHGGRLSACMARGSAPRCQSHHGLCHKACVLRAPTAFSCRTRSSCKTLASVGWKPGKPKKGGGSPPGICCNLFLKLLQPPLLLEFHHMRTELTAHKPNTPVQ